jgi:Xaa-Pro dipeptidase
MLKEELTGRLSRLQGMLAGEGLDAYIIGSEENIWYLTNITYKPEERPFFIVVSPGEKPLLVVPKMEELHLSKITVDCSIVSYWEYPSPEGGNWYDVLGQVLGGYRRVGTESHLKAGIIEKIATAEVVLTDLVDEMRKVKSPHELSLIKKTAAFCDAAVGKIFKNAYPGATAVEPFSLSRSVQTELIRNRAFDPITTSLLTAVWPAPISAMPHSIPALDDRLGKGPNVSMSYLRINGYAAECERTFFLGQPEAEEKERFGYMMQSRREALRVLKAGVRCSDVDAAAKEYLLKQGFADHLLHRTGHGIGLRNHEAPWIAEGNDEILRENMVISIEPGIYFTGSGGYRHSDTVLVTRDGYELLTRFPVELADMTLTAGSLSARIKGKLIRKALKL